MSGPFGVSLTVISGQKHSGEIAIAASTFLSMGYMSVDPVGNDMNIRPEFLKAIKIFINREDLDCHNGPDYFVTKLKSPSNEISTKDLFWLALDPEGEAIAEKIFDAHGDPVDKRIYHSVHKLNRLEPVVALPPQSNMPLSAWEESRQRHFGLLVQYVRKSLESYTSFVNRNAPQNNVEKEYHAWFESLYMSLIPWQDTIKNIQSDSS
jgi:hypothetical protein